jgi:hypothetical protein
LNLEEDEEASVEATEAVSAVATEVAAEDSEAAEVALVAASNKDPQLLLLRLQLSHMLVKVTLLHSLMVKGYLYLLV